ncbi:unnamed protein product, partial [Meganyctiphanes norvegica]
MAVKSKAIEDVEKEEGFRGVAAADAKSYGDCDGAYGDPRLPPENYYGCPPEVLWATYGRQNNLSWPEEPASNSYLNIHSRGSYHQAPNSVLYSSQASTTTFGWPFGPVPEGPAKVYKNGGLAALKGIYNGLASGGGLGHSDMGVQGTRADPTRLFGVTCIPNGGPHYGDCDGAYGDPRSDKLPPFPNRRPTNQIILVPGVPEVMPASGPTDQRNYTGNNMHNFGGFVPPLNYNKPSVVPANNFNAREDAEGLRKAMKGLGTNEMAIINILTHRSNYQRQQIIMSYKQAYERDLIKDLRKELTGHFETLILSLMKSLPVYLAQELHSAMKGAGTNENTLVEILCARDHSHLCQIKEAYKKEFDEDLDDDLDDETSGQFLKFLREMINGKRGDVTDDESLAKNLANQLWEAGEGRKGTAEAEFTRILSHYSYPLLRQVFKEYEKIADHDFGTAIEKEISGDLKAGMTAVYCTIENTAKFFAKELRDSMAGVGTRDKKLIRIVVSRCEVDMKNIKHEYEQLFNKTLEKDIKGDTHGDYEDALLALVSGDS